MRPRRAGRVAKFVAALDLASSPAKIELSWLTDDRAVPFTRVVKGKTYKINKPYQAALAFAGSDVLDFGFLPGRNRIYVVCGFQGANGHAAMQTYLVPFLTSKPPKQ